MMHPAFFFTSGTRALSVFSTLRDYFAYDFVRNALIAGVLISLCAGLLGVVLVLKRYSMIGGRAVARCLRRDGCRSRARLGTHGGGSAGHCRCRHPAPACQ